MSNYDAVLIIANTVDGCRVADFSDYPDAEITNFYDFMKSLRTLSDSEIIFTLILPAETDGEWEKLTAEYSIKK